MMRDTRTTAPFSDTSQKAQSVYFQRLREMTPSERLGCTSALWKAAHSLRRAAARRGGLGVDDEGLKSQVDVQPRIETGAEGLPGTMSPADAFDPLRIALEHAKIRFAIGGSWASTAFGEPRFTNDVDILAELTEEAVERFVENLPKDFYADKEDALTAVRHGRPFNVIYMPMAFKFDFFPAAAFALGIEELDRAVYLGDTALSKVPVPFVTPEDILLAKLFWFRSGNEASEVQWRDITGILRACAGALDFAYLERGALKVGISDLLRKALCAQ